MTRFAENTKVPSEQSRMEIERTLVRYGATEFCYGTKDNKAMIAFKFKDRFIRFFLTMPDRNAREFTLTPARGQKRSQDQAFTMWEQACRQRWRALALLIKAKLEAIESGIVTFEQEFIGNTLLPNGQTVCEYVLPKVTVAYQTQSMPEILPGLSKVEVEVLTDDR